MPISLEPMDEFNIDTETNNIKINEIKDKSISLMKRDLADYRKRMGNKATFKGWLSHIVPENITIDKRLENSDSEWKKIWEESSKRLTRKRSLKHKRNQTAKQLLLLEDKST